MTNIWRAFSRDDQTWLYTYMEVVWRGRVVLGSLASALAVFALGLVLASVSGFASLYLTSVPVYYGTFGIAWVSYWGAWGDRALVRSSERALQAFITKSEIESIVRDELRGLFRGINQAVIAAITAAALVAYAATRTYASSDGLDLFPDAWSSQPSLFLKNVVLALYALPVSLFVVTMIDGVQRYMRIVFRLSREDLGHPLLVAKYHLRPLAAWGVRTGFAWLIGLSLFVFLGLFGRDDQRADLDGARLIPAIMLVAFLAIWALALLLWPHICFRRTLNSALSTAVEDTEEDVRRVLGASVVKVSRYRALRRTSIDLRNYEALLEEYSRTSPWLYSRPGEWILFAAQALIPFASLLLLLR